MKAKDLVKARLWCLDNDAWSVEFQFNPSTLSLSREMDPGEGDGDGAFGGPPEWDSGARDTLSFELLVDTSVGGEIDLADATAFEAAMLSAISSLFGSENEDSILPLVHDFYRFTLPITPAAENAPQRPPVVAFVWEEFEFMGFVSSFDCDFKLFDHNGRAKRAEITIEMEGRAFSGGIDLEDFLAGAYNPGSGSGTGSRSGEDGRFDLADLA
ncbi:MAG: hypothetical protein KC656_10815 [Myxococcales bacterium]|nr:hypothetical protein [Myxococcales bacterium]MCB9670647.1 hypothetical protein [Alphaproteobacteria bacterium]MCB9693791.1 hypothetical protein [Alphaproteobacteria bacterium]